VLKTTVFLSRQGCQCMCVTRSEREREHLCLAWVTRPFLYKACGSIVYPFGEGEQSSRLEQACVLALAGSSTGRHWLVIVGSV
jgi:hypothetical protein